MIRLLPAALLLLAVAVPAHAEYVPEVPHYPLDPNLPKPHFRPNRWTLSEELLWEERMRRLAAERAAARAAAARAAAASASGSGAGAATTVGAGTVAAGGAAVVTIGASAAMIYYEQQMQRERERMLEDMRNPPPDLPHYNPSVPLDLYDPWFHLHHYWDYFLGGALSSNG